MKNDSLVDRINALLPQTQCTQCGFSGCRPYAEAIAEQRAEINQCPPGGVRGITALAQLLDRSVIPLNPLHGDEKPRRLAQIDEGHCIGCTLCIQACPVDAIIGAPKQMHIVISDYCTGCDLCVTPCPVDCIEMITPTPSLPLWNRENATVAQQRYEARKKRLHTEQLNNEKRLAAKAAQKLAGLEQEIAQAKRPDPRVERKRAIIQAAIERARQRRIEHHNQNLKSSGD